ncbi:MAG: hypothetical protein WD770_04865, partial [Actinomycetota bacterium]
MLRTLRIVSIAAVASLVAVVSQPIPALGAYPGRNGKIAFVSMRDGVEQVYVMKATGAEQTNLTNDTTIRDILPVWSPDGANLLVTRKLPDTSFDIWSVNARTGTATQLTSDRAPDIRATWSPDGARFAFASGRGGTDSEILVADTSGVEQNVVVLTDNGTTDAQPAWSPLG